MTVVIQPGPVARKWRFLGKTLRTDLGRGGRRSSLHGRDQSKRRRRGIRRCAAATGDQVFFCGLDRRSIGAIGQCPRLLFLYLVFQLVDPALERLNFLCHGRL